MESRGTRLFAIEHTVLRAPDKAPLSECLRRITRAAMEIIERTSPEAVAIEGIFYCRNVKTAVILGEARGAVIAACAERGLPIFEYEPRRVKQAVVGTGGADKEQVRRMVTRLLGLAEAPPLDASDALAIAICHLHNNTKYQWLTPRSI